MDPREETPVGDEQLAGTEEPETHPDCSDCPAGIGGCPGRPADCDPLDCCGETELEVQQEEIREKLKENGILQGGLYDFALNTERALPDVLRELEEDGLASIQALGQYMGRAFDAYHQSSRRKLIQAVHKLAACASLLLDREDIIETPIAYDEPDGPAEFLNEKARPVWLALIVPGCPQCSWRDYHYPGQALGNDPGKAERLTYTQAKATGNPFTTVHCQDHGYSWSAYVIHQDVANMLHNGEAAWLRAKAGECE